VSWSRHPSLGGPLPADLRCAGTPVPTSAPTLSLSTHGYTTASDRRSAAGPFDLRQQDPAPVPAPLEKAVAMELVDPATRRDPGQSTVQQTAVQAAQLLTQLAAVVVRQRAAADRTDPEAQRGAADAASRQPAVEAESFDRGLLTDTSRPSPRPQPAVGDALNRAQAAAAVAGAEGDQAARDSAVPDDLNTLTVDEHQVAGATGGAHHDSQLTASATADDALGEARQALALTGAAFSQHTPAAGVTQPGQAPFAAATTTTRVAGSATLRR